VTGTNGKIIDVRAAKAKRDTWMQALVPVVYEDDPRA
jgi:hypothetical protein